MTKKSFTSYVSEMYQGEVVGEVAFNRMLLTYTSPAEHYKVGTMLQLETEAKGKLRPIVMELGGDILETEESRSLGHQFADAMEGKSWKGAMAVIREGVGPYLENYKQAVQVAPKPYKAIAEYMLRHEQSLYDFAHAEENSVSGDNLQPIIAQLSYPLPKPE